LKVKKSGKIKTISSIPLEEYKSDTWYDIELKVQRNKFSLKLYKSKNSDETPNFDEI